jgi:hypothetical protein
VTCSANNTSNQFVSRTSTNAVFVNAVRSMGMDSHISFTGSSTGACTAIYVEFRSWNQPKAL